MRGLLRTTVELSGMFPITIPFNPTFTLLPIITFGSTFAPAPNKQLLPITPPRLM